MALNNKLSEINKLQGLIDQHELLDDDIKTKINYRFRLDWNYHSNAIEGGTLNKEETRSVMIGSIEIGGKSIRDVFEMKGHDNIVKEILLIGKGEMRLSEKRIKTFHKAIIHEEDEEKTSLLGNWKKDGNHVINYKLEKHSFTAPSEVPDLMHSLIDKTNALIDSLKTKASKVHPALIALQFHIEFINIHPFYDGNGRMARILSNLLLVSFGFPPFVVNKEDKDRYNKLIADIQCYGGKEDLFYEFLCELIIRSQNIVLEAIEGKDITQDDDFEKELSLLDQEFTDAKEAKLRMSNSLIKALYSNSFQKLFQTIDAKLSKLDSRFNQKNVSYRIDSFIPIIEDEKVRNDLEGLENQVFFSFQEPEKYGHAQDYEYPVIKAIRPQISEIEASYNWNGYKRAGTKAFNIHARFYIRFHEFRYVITESSNNNNNFWVEKLYDENLTDENISKIVKLLETDIIERLKSVIESIKKENDKLNKK